MTPHPNQTAAYDSESNEFLTLGKVPELSGFGGEFAFYLSSIRFDALPLDRQQAAAHVEHDALRRLQVMRASRLGAHGRESEGDNVRRVHAENAHVDYLELSHRHASSYTKVNSATDYL